MPGGIHGRKKSPRRVRKLQGWVVLAVAAVASTETNAVLESRVRFLIYFLRDRDKLVFGKTEREE